MLRKFTALVLLAGLIFTSLSCSKEPLAHAKALLDKGDLDKARAVLEESLAEQPDSLEARALLTEVELAAEAPMAALEHILVLDKANYDTTILEESLRQVLDNGTRRENIDCVLRLLEADPGRGAELALHVLSRRCNETEVVAAVLPRLVSEVPEQQWPLDTWENFLAKDPAAAWNLSDSLPEQFRERIILYLASLPQKERDEIDAQFLAKGTGYPGLHDAAALLLEDMLARDAAQDPERYSLDKLNLILVVNPPEIDARHLQGLDPADIVSLASSDEFLQRETGNTLMDLLLAWENQDYKPANPDAYSEAKYSLLYNGCIGGPLSEAHFDNIDAVKLWDLGLYWLGGNYDPNELDDSMNTLAKVIKVADPSLGKAMGQIINPPPPPAPQWNIPEDVYSQWDEFPPITGIEFSPDGNYMVYHDDWYNRDPSLPLRTYWVNLEDQDIVLTLEGQWTRHWSPDSSKLALSSEEKVIIYSSQGQELCNTDLSPEARVLGWQNNSLLILQPQSAQYTVTWLNTTGQETESLTFSHEPTLTAEGKAAAVWLEGGRLWVSIEGEVRDYPAAVSEGTLHSWLPGDRGLIWEDGRHQQNPTYYMLKFAQGTWTAITPPPAIYFHTSWRDDREIYAMVEIEGAPFILKDIVVYNIDTGEITHTGISRNMSRISNSHIHQVRRDKGNRLEIYALP